MVSAAPFTPPVNHKHKCCFRDRAGAGGAEAARAAEGTCSSPSQAEPFQDCCSPRSPGPFVLHAHHRGEFQCVLSVGTKTALSQTGGSSEAPQKC